jgi:hypothetical protein
MSPFLTTELVVVYDFDESLSIGRGCIDSFSFELLDGRLAVFKKVLWYFR